MHYNCLVVDDEIELAKATCEYFQMFDTSCSWVSNAADCEIFLQNNTIDVLLLDINLEKSSGFELCKKIRQTSNVPILFISARQSDDDVLIALNIGGDDYIKKPYTLSVLLAKVKVILRRKQETDQALQANAGTSIATNKAVTANEGTSHATNQAVTSDAGTSIATNKAVTANEGTSIATNQAVTSNTGTHPSHLENSNIKSVNANIRLDDNRMRVFVGEKEVTLKAKEYKLFSYMYANANRILAKDELFNAVWGDSFFSDGTLNVHIRKLREKIEDNPNEPKFIKTVWGTGYILEL